MAVPPVEVIFSFLNLVRKFAEDICLIVIAFLIVNNVRREERKKKKKKLIGVTAEKGVALMTFSYSQKGKR